MLETAVELRKYLDLDLNDTSLPLDCEPSLHFAISGTGVAHSLVWPCGVMQAGGVGLEQKYLCHSVSLLIFH